MLEPYPKGALDREGASGDDPMGVLQWFDPAPYRAMRQQPMGNLWVQGGVRERVFFADNPHRSPTLNKLPFIRWNWRFAYVNSTHSALPRRLNGLYDGPGGTCPAGVLLHTKFLPEIVSRSGIEKARAQHFAKPKDFEEYYDALTAAPDLWTEGAVRYGGVAQLIELGLMPKLGWES
jgi:hypothetical protein